MPQRDEGMPDSPTTEGPRPLEGHRRGLGSFRRDGRGGGRGPGKAGGWAACPGTAAVPGAGPGPAGGAAGHAPSTAGKGGERQLATAHARWPPPSHHYLRAARRCRLLFLSRAGARACRALLAAGRGAGGRGGGGGDQARHAARAGSAPLPRQPWPCCGRACAVAAARLRHPRPGLVGEAEGERGSPGACETRGKQLCRLLVALRCRGPLFRLRWQPRPRDSPCVWE